MCVLVIIRGSERFNPSNFANSRRLPNVVLMLDQRLRRWPNNKTALGQRRQIREVDPMLF